MDIRSEPIIKQIVELIDGVKSHLPQLQSAVDDLPEEDDAIRLQAKEIVEHLVLCVNSLDKAIADHVIHSMPVLELTNIHTHCTNVLKFLPQVVGNVAQQQGSLSTQVDGLHQKLWQARLIDAGEEEFAYKKIVGELTVSVQKVLGYAKELKKDLAIRDEVRIALEEVNRLKQEMQSITEEAGRNQSQIQVFQQETSQFNEQVKVDVSKVETLLETGQQRDATLRSIEADLKKWHKEIDAKQKIIDTLRDSTDIRLSNYDKDIQVRQQRLDAIDKKIKEQFRLAASGALAKAFGRRGSFLLIGKFGWGSAAFLSYISAVIFACWLAIETIPKPLENGSLPPLDWRYFLVRLAVGIPIGFLVWFVTVQFGKARRLQEAYAFKGSVASSFDAYRDLIEKVSKDPELKGNPDYAKFITRTIQGLYDPPTLDKKDDEQPAHSKSVREMSVLVRQVAKVLGKLR